MNVKFLRKNNDKYPGNRNDGFFLYFWNTFRWKRGAFLRMTSDICALYILWVWRRCEWNIFYLKCWNFWQRNYKKALPGQQIFVDSMLKKRENFILEMYTWLVEYKASKITKETKASMKMFLKYISLILKIYNMRAIYFGQFDGLLDIDGVLWKMEQRRTKWIFNRFI